MDRNIRYWVAPATATSLRPGACLPTMSGMEHAPVISTGGGDMMRSITPEAEWSLRSFALGPWHENPMLFPW